MTSRGRIDVEVAGMTGASARRMRLGLCAVALLGAGASGPAAEDGVPAGVQPLAAPGSGAWKPLRFPGISRHTDYAVIEDGGEPVLRSDSECAASAMILPTPDVDLAATPLLRWRWQIERGLDIADARTREGDDFAARVYVAFRFQPEKASAWERMRRSAAALVYGAELPGRALNYVWSSREPAGRAWDNPRTADSRMLSLGRGPLPTWRDEEVDVAADYRASFGEPPPQLLFVAVMTDSDDSCGSAAARFGDFRFAARTAARPQPGRDEAETP